MSNKHLPLESHLEIADRLAISIHHFQKIFDIVNESDLNLSHPVKKELRKLFRMTWFDSLKYRLDEDYHNSISDEVYIEHGHIYYDSDRYDKVVENFAHIKWFKKDEEI